VGGPRLALLGAFPFPYPQGSQVFAGEQARALRAAGAQPLFFSYGRGQGERPRDVELVTTPRWASPRRMRSGPRWGKPLADAFLLGRYLQEARRERFDAALAHNAEAAVVALAARAHTRVPVVYVAHTILSHELSAYGPSSLAPALDRTGAALDRWIARRADAVIALCEAGRRSLAPHARSPVVVIPPGLDPVPPPAADLRAALCRRLGLERGGFILYTGNLDAYQELDLLRAAASRLPAATPAIVIATHDARGANRRAGESTRVRYVEIGGIEEVRALCAEARLLVATRRRPGGFPIKLLNYMEAARPIVVFEGAAADLEHGRSAWVVPDSTGAAGLADSIARLLDDAALCQRLGAGARLRLETRHAWPAIAESTLAVVTRLRRG